MLYMLDTDTASYIIKGRMPAIEKKLEAIPPSDICISSVTKTELVYGLKHLPSSHRLHLGVHQFLKIVRILAWDADAADFYAEICYQLVKSGQPIGELDMMIAAHALASGAALVTNNQKHFKRIKLPLILVNWV